MSLEELRLNEHEECLCSRCHWWTASLGNGAFRVCVLLNGLKGTKVAPVNFGTKPLMTRGNFGCCKWEPDQRKERPVDD